MRTIRNQWRRIVDRFRRPARTVESSYQWNTEENTNRNDSYITLGDLAGYVSNGNNIVTGPTAITGTTGIAGTTGGALPIYYNNYTPDAMINVEGNTVASIRNMTFDRPNQLNVRPGEILVGNVDQPQVNVVFDSTYWRPRMVEDNRFNMHQAIMILERIPASRSEYAVHYIPPVENGWDTNENQEAA